MAIVREYGIVGDFVKQVCGFSGPIQTIAIPAPLSNSVAHAGFVRGSKSFLFNNLAFCEHLFDRRSLGSRNSDCGFAASPRQTGH